MGDLLWQKPGVTVDERIMQFLAGEDVLLDSELFLFDIEASIVHVQGLERITILNADESERLQKELKILIYDFKNGNFVLDRQYEDGHSAIESRLTERLGDTGRKVHTGRSRNDQVLVASRLFLKAQLIKLHEQCIEIANVCLNRAENESLPMPGYTHLQRAVVSSTAMWFAGFAEAFIDDAMLTAQTLNWIDANPLGTAAGYGVNLSLDRDYTTAALGFGRMQISPIYAQLSRGKYELQVLTTLSQALLDTRRLAWDLSLFTTSEFSFVELPPEYTTGSSIMPNKRNPDVIELLRASYAVVQAAKTEIEALLSLPSGYQRDLQFSKAPLLRACAQGLSTLALLPDLLTRMRWNAVRMRTAIEPAMYATDYAVDLARQGVPFREAYRRAASTVDVANDNAPEQSLAARQSPGAAADLRLNELRQRLQSL